MKSQPIVPCLKRLLCVIALAFLWGSSAQAAMNSYMQLTLNGTAVSGDVSLFQIGGVDVSSDHIECHAVNFEFFGGGTGRLQATPLKIVKRIDKSSPVLAKGISRNENARATLRYFRQNEITGDTEEYFRVIIDNARISSIRHWTPSNLDPSGSQFPFMEEVSFTYQRVTLEDLIHGNQTEIDLGALQ